MTSVLARKAQYFAIAPEEYWDWHEQKAQKAEQRASPVDMQSSEHGGRKKRKAGSKDPAYKIVSGKYAADIRGVGVALVEEQGVE